jgi:hypothetical protein
MVRFSGTLKDESIEVTHRCCLNNVDKLHLCYLLYCRNLLYTMYYVYYYLDFHSSYVMVQLV